MKYLLMITLLLSFSCRKEYSCESCVDTGYKIATVIFTGEPSVDGCGWLIKVDSTLYHPEVLDSSFLQHNLSVEIVFEKLPDKFVCGKQPLEYTTIHLVSIVK